MAPYDPLRSRGRVELPDDSGIGPAVEQLLEEVELQTELDPIVRVEGIAGQGAIVTGGSMGIGKAVALMFARAGVHIAFNYLDDEAMARGEAEKTASQLESYGVEVLHRPVDCTEPQEVGRFVADALDHFDRLHILVNNAGVTRQQALEEMSDEEWKVVLETNLSGAFYFIRAVAPVFRTQEFGKIVNIASVHGTRSEHGLANLAASKAGVLALTRSAALELGPHNVNVNAVAPGYIRTTRLTQQVSAETLDRVREQSALRRLGDPQDVAGAVLFLCSEAARHITGAALPVDGGYMM